MHQLAKTIFEHAQLLCGTNLIRASIDNIHADLNAIASGRTIKILSSIDQDNDGCFVLRGETYIVVMCNKSIAKASVITEEELIEILSLFYACRELSLITADRSDRIFDLTGKLDRILISLTERNIKK